MIVTKVMANSVIFYLTAYIAKQDHDENRGHAIPKPLYVLFFPFSKWRKVRTFSIILAPVCELIFAVAAVFLLLGYGDSPLLEVAVRLPLLALTEAMGLELILDAHDEKSKFMVWSSRIFGTLLCLAPLAICMVLRAEVSERAAELLSIIFSFVVCLLGVIIGIKAPQRLSLRLLIVIPSGLLLVFCVIWMVRFITGTG
jgi:hypothetical protein